MKHQEAVDLIKNGVKQHGAAQVWADLGCGSGTFTLALASLLAAGTVHAVDKNKTAISTIPDHFEDVAIIKYLRDFTSFRLPHLDGVLMANALHFVKEKKTFLERTFGNLRPDGYFLIVEYDTDVANSWVPYPVSFHNLQVLFRGIGLSSVKKLGEVPSIYNTSHIYAAVVHRSAAS